MRVIVCGSREWADRGAVRSALTIVWNERSNSRVPLVVVHGACPRGADAFADEWARDTASRVERYTAAWSLDGKAAGPIRNEQMARDGADLCVAFWDGKSPGTLDMIKRAVAHAIPVRIVPAKKPTPPRPASGREGE